MPVILPGLIYLAGSVLIPVLKGRIRQIYLMAVAVLGLVNVFMLKAQSSWATDFIGFKITLLHVDRISLFVGYIFVIIGFCAILYSLRVEETWHHLLTFWYVGCSLGAVFAGDLLSFYGFWELMAVASAGIVLLNPTRVSREAGYRYLLMHLIGGAVLVGGIFVHYMQTGSLAIEPMAAGLAFSLVLFGVGMNTGFVLLHTWLPDAYPRALFTGSVFMSVYTTKTAVYALIRLAPGWDFVAYMGATMAVFGVTLALIQSNPRKLLSYHIVSQVGYMVAAIGLGGALGLNGGIFHLFNHILYKALLFMTIGAVIYRTGKDDLTEMGGVMRKMPITTACAVIASLSIAGAPLFNGFVSKALIFQAAEANITIELMLELAAVGTFMSFFKFTYFGFIRPNKEIEMRATEAPLNMTIAMGITAALCVIIGSVPAVAVPYLPFELPAVETNFYTAARVLGVLQLMAVSGFLFFMALPVFSPHRRRTYDFDWFYIQAGQGLQQVAAGVDWFNTVLENILGKLVPAIMSLRKPIYKLNELSSRLFFALFVDMWLSRPLTPSVRGIEKKKLKKADTNKKETHMIEDLARVGGNIGDQVKKIDVKIIDRTIHDLARIGERASDKMSKVDKNIIDRLIEGLARMGGELSTQMSKIDILVIDWAIDHLAIISERISKYVGIFDLKVVDGIVNGVGHITGRAAQKLRPVQTGDVQTYGMVMIGGLMFLLIFLVLIFYGVINFT